MLQLLYNRLTAILCEFGLGYLQRDIDRHTPFLRRMRLDSVKLKDLFPGNKLLVLTRHLVILDYADSLTRDYVQPKCER